jgi:uncharacterized glyoxalase superfamily protein PhnB
MAGNVKPVPDGTHTITPHLIIRNAAQAIEFYQKAFGAQVLHVHHMPNGKIMHALMRIGDSNLMLADEFPEMGGLGPESLGGSPVYLHVYVDNVDALFNQAVAAGAKVTMPLANQFWGDRYGQVVDPFGHRWSLGMHIEDVSQEESERRFQAMMAEMAKKGK